MGNDHITQHIRYGYVLPFGTLLPSVAMSYTPRTLGEMSPSILKED